MGTPVTNIEARVAQIELEVSQLKPSLMERITKLEGMFTKTGSTSDSILVRFLGWMGVEAPKFLAAAVLLGMTWWIKDSVDAAISRQQLQLSFTKEMQSQLEKMADPKANDKEIERAALLIAAYGGPGIAPLLNETRYGDLRANGAEAGLRYLALVDPESLCRVLPRVLDNHTRQFGWNSHLRVIRLLGESGCTRAQPQLSRYLEAVNVARVGKIKAPYYDLIADEPKPDEFDQLDKALKRSIGLLAKR